jgi:UDP-N-acetylglucosamine pyrophosphorylase
LNNYLESIQIALLKKKGTQRFPRNTEVKNALKEKDIYSSKSKNRLYLLERLENYRNRETVEISDNSNITVEHIFPQKPDTQWKSMLKKDEYEELEEKYLNTLANLTLSGNNGSLGNRYFTDKRDMNIDGKEQGYKFSRLWKLFSS